MIPINQENFQCDDKTLVEDYISIKSSPHRASAKNQKKQKHKGRDRFILADVTPDYCIPSPCSRAKGKGKRRQHRIENVKFLLNFGNKNDDDYVETNECEVTETPFTRIVSDDSLRQIWNNFSELSGEQQDQYLAFVKRDFNDKHNLNKWLVPGVTNCQKFLMIYDAAHHYIDITRNGVTATVNGMVSKECPNSKKTDGINLSADLCYYRMERRLRNALKKKHLPLGLLEKLESEMIDFFEKWPKSKYVSVLSSSYERLLTHALCQYLGLLSQSVMQNGNRCTEVKTRKDQNFHAPFVTLSQYIKERL